MIFRASALRSTETKESESFTEEKELRHDRGGAGRGEETEKEPYITRIALCSFAEAGNRVTLL